MRTWLKVDSGLGHSLKVARTADALKISEAELVGHLMFLWGWAQNFAPDGFVGDHKPAVIASASRWEGRGHRPERLLEVLREEGWIGPDGRLHEWDKWGGAVLAERTYERQRKREFRGKSRGQSGGSPGDSPGEVRSLEEEVEVDKTNPSGDTKPPREKDELWNSFVAVLGTTPSNTNERGKWNTGLKACRESELFPAEVAGLVEFCRRSWPDASTDWNPQACSGHIAAFRNGPVNESRAFTEEELS